MDTKFTCTGSTTSFLTSNILAKGRIFKPPSVGFGAEEDIADDFFGDSFSLVAALESKKLLVVSILNSKAGADAPLPSLAGSGGLLFQTGVLLPA